jgi:ADP-ribose pyrophosphatase YjhB (NUDIX family)
VTFREEDETPLEACRREKREELGMDLSTGRLLVVDWVPRQSVWSDMMNFVSTAENCPMQAPSSYKRMNSQPPNS